MKALTSCFYVIALYCAFLAGGMLIKASSFLPIDGAHRDPRPRLPWATLTLLGLIAAPTGLQFFIPALLPILERDAVRLRAGDWWRLVTPLFVQDGGLSGGIFNLVSLFLIGMVAERLWGSRRWLVLFFACGILSEALACAWQPVGAGNSVATFALAAAVAVRCLTVPAAWSVRFAAAFCLVAGIFLLLLQDIHGIAVALGAFAGLFLSWWDARMVNHTPKPE